MTRVLSELLGAGEPAFHLHLRQLERSAGGPNADIRLSVEVQQQLRRTISSLGLDPNDTTGHELYAALGQRLHADERQFAAALEHGTTKIDDPIARIAMTLKQYIEPKTCLAMKPAVAKRLLKTQLPKKTMKILGYRSADSMIKHESIASLFAAAWLLETEQWTRRMHTSYTKLKASDFETRAISIDHPSSKRWQALAESTVALKRHNILSFKELGAVVLLPLPKNRPELTLLTTAVLTLHAVNDIYAATTYLKLHQVQAQFGVIVKTVALGQSNIGAHFLDQPIAWSTVQRFYARFSSSLHDELLEPVLQAEDFAWHSVEQVLARIEPSLQFWTNTHHVAKTNQGGGDPVSCNLTDLVLSHCNGLAYEQRFLQHFRHELRTELSFRYLSLERLQQTVNQQFQKQFAFEPVTA